jgi:hypothetical protein
MSPSLDPPPPSAQDFTFCIGPHALSGFHEYMWLHFGQNCVLVSFWMVGMSYLLLMLGGQRKGPHLHFVIAGDSLDP